MEKMKKIVLFDLDGTLVDSFDSVLYAIKEAMQSLRIPVPREIYSECEVGKLLPIAENHLPCHISKTDFKNKYDNILSNNPLNGVKLNDNAIYLTGHLKRLGYTLVVLTNKRQSIATAICDSLFAPHTFDAIIGRKSSLPIKPYQKAVEALNANGIQLSQIRCLIGDSKEDQLTAELLRIDFYDIRVSYEIIINRLS